uniref:Uncharacterized protein n=1 Tax=Salix viminalis TaxID=40686 RepID=A0A6N2L2T4_SALVM
MNPDNEATACEPRSTRNQLVNPTNARLPSQMSRPSLPEIRNERQEINKRQQMAKITRRKRKQKKVFIKGKTVLTLPQSTVPLSLHVQEHPQKKPPKSARIVKSDRSGLILQSRLILVKANLIKVCPQFFFGFYFLSSSQITSDLLSSLKSSSPVSSSLSLPLSSSPSSSPLNNLQFVTSQG